MKQFAGKNILLTGASGTIGANIARKLMKADIGQLVMFVRRDDMMDAKTKMRVQNSANAHVEEIDFREPQRIEQKFTYCMKKHFKGRLDAVILCHGVVTELGVQNCSVPDYDQLMLVNVRSNVHLISLAFPFLKQSKSSAITLLTSTSGEHPDPRSTVMSIASAMQQQLIKCTALEGAHFGIRVNGVAAGVAYTKARLNKDSFGMNFTKEQNETFFRLAAQKVPLNKTVA